MPPANRLEKKLKGDIKGLHSIIDHTRLPPVVRHYIRPLIFPLATQLFL